MRIHFRVVCFAALAVLSACTNTTKAPSAVQSKLEDKFNDRQDHHSYANPSEVRVQHVALDLDVSFAEKVLRGSAILSLDRPNREKPLIIDSRDLKISRVEASADGISWSPTTFQTGNADRVLGAPVSIALPSTAKQVRIFYETAPTASGLQWLTPPQTAGKKHPFLFTQSQAIHARSWIPTQDSPGVRVHLSREDPSAEGLRAVMSARNDPKQKGTD